MKTSDRKRREPKARQGRRKGALLLSDGSFFEGYALGNPAKSFTREGEFVFHTGYTGYQEVLTDPSYCRQVIVFASPQIGNQGFHPDDFESKKIWASGCVMREYSGGSAHWRSRQSLLECLEEFGVPALEGVDTRRLVLRLRDRGCLWGVISTETSLRRELEKHLAQKATMEGMGLTSEVSTKTSYRWLTGSVPLLADRLPHTPSTLKRVVVFDFGVKRQILRYLVDVGFEEVIVVPASTTAEEVKALSPDAIVLSNGPGDPAADPRIIAEVKKLIGRYPILGICLGHQILGLALGYETYKMKFGHHAANHPVMNRSRARVELTSQNHGFAVRAPEFQSDILPTHIHLNDQSLAGFVHQKWPICGIQFHPEASPGPLDSLDVFRQLKRGEFHRL
jgi:carbamoyl-phosphate synthase small subunit